MWRKRKNYFDKWLKTNLWTLSFYFFDTQNYLHIMRTFLYHMKNETLCEIKTSQENWWQRMIQFFQYSFVLILKRKCLVRDSRVRCGESGTPSTIIYTRWSSRRYELGCDAPVFTTLIARFIGPTWGPPGSCRPQMDTMLSQWTLLSGYSSVASLTKGQ